MVSVIVSVMEEVIDGQMAKISEKTADKQKDVRYNGGRTKSNAALSMRGDFLWVLPANTNRRSGYLWLHKKSTMPPSTFGYQRRMAMLPLRGRQRATAFPTRKI